MRSVIFPQERLKREDTSLDVGSNDVSVDVEIDSDEFAL